MDALLRWAERPEAAALGLVIGVIGLILAIVVPVWQRQVKRLDYDIFNDVQMLHDDARALRAKLQVRYGGRRVVDPRIVTVRVKNTGNRAIHYGDYADPICIIYEMNPPLDATVVSTSKELKRVAPLSGNDGTGPGAVYFRPKLLNPGEWFDVQMVSDGEHGTITISSRFSDRARPMRSAYLVKATPETRNYAPVYLVFAFSALITVTLASFAPPSEVPLGLVPIIITWAVVLVSMKLIDRRIIAKRTKTTHPNDASNGD